MHKLVTAFVLCASLLFAAVPAPAQTPGATAPAQAPTPGEGSGTNALWAAIVFSATSWGSAWNHTSKDEAAAAARKKCGSSKCTSTVNIRADRCVSLYHFRGNGQHGYLSAGGDTREEAKSNTLERCQKEESGCTWATTVCQ